MPFFLGIDGGGTKTRCVLGNESSVLGSGSSSSCKVQRVGEACARDALAAAVHEACLQAGISPRQIARTCAGVTGAGRPEVAGIMRKLASGIVSGEVEIVGDIEIAFDDAFKTGPGVLVIAGTGSIAYGRNVKGETARAGGWGHAISDEGSGYWIGAEAVRAALHKHDHGEDSLLRDLMGAVRAANFDDFIVRINSDPAPDLGTLFPLVLAAANSGDSAADAILQRAGQELANLVLVLIKRLGETTVCVATHGGVFASSPQVKDAFSEHLKSHYANSVLIPNTIDPSRGALERARRSFAIKS